MSTEESPAVKRILEIVRESNLSARETMDLIRKLLNIEYSTPRLQLDVNHRATALIEIILEVITKYYDEKGALDFAISLYYNLISYFSEMDKPNYIK